MTAHSSSNGTTDVSNNSHKSLESRPGSAESRSSWLNMSKSTRAFTNSCERRSMKRMDACLDKDTGFIQQLEQKIVEREVSRRQASELLNKRWNDNVYNPIMSSIHAAMDQGGSKLNKQLQQQYAHYLNHNNRLDGNVFLDVFNEHSLSEGDYQPLKLKNMQMELIKPEKVMIGDDPLIQDSSKREKISLDGQSESTSSFWDKMVDAGNNIEAPERIRSQRRIKVDDTNRKSQINWSEWYKQSS